MTGIQGGIGSLVQIQVQRVLRMRRVVYTVDFLTIGGGNRHPLDILWQRSGMRDWGRLEKRGDVARCSVGGEAESGWAPSSARLVILETGKDPDTRKIGGDKTTTDRILLREGFEVRVSIVFPGQAMSDLIQTLVVAVGQYEGDNSGAGSCGYVDGNSIEIPSQKHVGWEWGANSTALESGVSNKYSQGVKSAPPNIGPPPGPTTPQSGAELREELSDLQRSNKDLTIEVERLNGKIEEFNRVADTATAKTASEHRRDIRRLEGELKTREVQLQALEVDRANLGDQVIELRKQLVHLQRELALSPSLDGRALERLIDLVQALTAKGETDHNFVRRVRDELQPALVRLQGEVSHNPELQQSVTRTLEFISRSDPGGLEAARDRALEEPNEAIQLAIRFLEDRSDDRPALSPHNIEEQLKTIALQAFGDREMFESLRPSLDSCLGAVGLSLLIPGTGQSYQSAHHQIMARRRAPGQGENRILRVLKPGLLRADAVVAKAQVEIS